MGDDKKLNRIEDILPQDIRRGSERSHGIEEGVRHPNAEGGVLLTEGLSGGDTRDAGHSGWRRSGVDEYVLVVDAFRGRRKVVADEFAKTELEKASKERGDDKKDNIRYLGVEIEDGGLRHNGGKNHDRGDPEIEGDDRNFHGQNELLAGLPFIGEAKEPGGEERSEQERCDAGEDEQESRKERHIRRRVDQRKSSRNDDRRRKIREKGEGREVLDGTAHFACNNRCCRSCRHDKTHEYALRKDLISGPVQKGRVRSEGEEHLCCQDDPMPAMEAQVEGIHFAESEEEHKKDEPRECGCEWQEEFIANVSDEHREPEGVTIEPFFHLVIYHLVIYLII